MLSARPTVRVLRLGIAIHVSGDLRVASEKQNPLVKSLIASRKSPGKTHIHIHYRIRKKQCPKTPTPRHGLNSRLDSTIDSQSEMQKSPTTSTTSRLEFPAAQRRMPNTLSGNCTDPFVSRREAEQAIESYSVFVCQRRLDDNRRKRGRENSRRCRDGHSGIPVLLCVVRDTQRHWRPCRGSQATFGLFRTACKRGLIYHYPDAFKKACDSRQGRPLGIDEATWISQHSPAFAMSGNSASPSAAGTPLKAIHSRMAGL